MSEEDNQVSFPIYGDVDDSIKVSRRLRDEPRLTHKGVSFGPKRDGSKTVNLGHASVKPMLLGEKDQTKGGDIVTGRHGDLDRK